MKFVPLIGLLSFSFVSSLLAEQVPLWSEGKTPYAKPIDDETKSPSISVYSTKGSPNHTGAAVVICPGGGYGGLAKDHEGHQPAQWFNEQGVSAFVLQYRLGSQKQHYPAQLADVQRAIRWVRAQAGEFGLAKDRIAVMGFSAGGHLASMAATLYDENAYEASDSIDEVSARPDFAILCYPVISLDSEFTHRGSRKNLLGPDQVDEEALATKLSTDKNITAETPPTFLFQTNADTSVPAENATRFFLALREHGVPVEFHCYQNGPHGIGLYRGDPILGGWSDLLKNWLLVNSFYAVPKAKVAVTGKVTLDGEPASWGILTFHPEDKNQPPTSVRVRRGKFSAKSDVGPVVGAATLTFEGSIWELTVDAGDKAVSLSSLSPGNDEQISLPVSEGMEPLHFDFSSK
ncbi:alpha/beta hydrolase [Verrucomicrobiales bacterium]|nr:alpha/beta hydrolase [Verrucomicrobiales bacterium]